MTKVLIYHPWIYLKGGAEKVLAEYIKRTSLETKVQTSFLGEHTYSDLIDATQVNHNCIGVVNVKRTIFNSLKSLIAIFTTKLSKQPVDTLLVSSEGLGDFVGLFRGKVAQHTIAYVHTPLKLVYDKESLPSTQKRMGYFSFRLFFYVIRPLYKIINRLIWQRYDFIVANSTETRQRILDGKLAAPEKIKIVYPGANLIDQNEVYSSPDKFAHHQYLIAGRIMIQKNIEMGIQAFNAANVEKSTLVITGHCDDKSQSYLADLINTYASNKVIFKPNPSDAEYHQLFQTSKCLIFTAINEEWGIIPVESMAYGMPVICANQGGPSESVINGQTGFLCEPNATAFSKAIVEFESFAMPRYNEYSLAARERAKEFTWDKFAINLDQVINDVKTSK